MFLSYNLFEGGKATAKFGTRRVTKDDLSAILPKLSSIFGIPEEEAPQHFVGSTKLVFDGTRDDCGDIDFAIEHDDVASLVKTATSGFGVSPIKITNTVYSFPVSIGDDKVQFDLMVVENLEWSKFSYYADPESKYKSGVRNELIHAILRNKLKKGKDLIVKDDDGNTIAKTAHVFHLDSGVKRVFKIANPKQNGDGYVKELTSVDPKDFKKFTTENGITAQHAEEEYKHSDVNIFCSMLFDDSITPDDISSAEKMIALIKQKFQPKMVAKIFKTAVEGIKRRKLEIPEELNQYQ